MTTQEQALREALEEWDNSFCWRVCPDKKGDHTVEDFVIQRCLKATRKALATPHPSDDHLYGYIVGGHYVSFKDQAEELFKELGQEIVTVYTHPQPSEAQTPASGEVVAWRWYNVITCDSGVTEERDSMESAKALGYMIYPLTYADAPATEGRA